MCGACVVFVSCICGMCVTHIRAVCVFYTWCLCDNILGVLCVLHVCCVFVLCDMCELCVLSLWLKRVCLWYMCGMSV